MKNMKLSRMFIFKHKSISFSKLETFYTIHMFKKRLNYIFLYKIYRSVETSSLTFFI